MNNLCSLLRSCVLGAALTVGVCAKAPAQSPTRSWEIGPTINGRNYSLGLSRPSSFKGGWGFAISSKAQPHYVTFRHGSLRSKRQIRMRYRVEGPEGAVIHGAKCSTGAPSAVTLYFQRSDDDWGTDGARWWAAFASVPLSGPTGEKEIIASLTGNWSSVLKMTAANSPSAFAQAKMHADRVGFTFANCEGLGHGARAMTPVRFVVTQFQVF